MSASHDHNHNSRSSLDWGMALCSSRPRAMPSRARAASCSWALGALLAGSNPLRRKSMLLGVYEPPYGPGSRLRLLIHEGSPPPIIWLPVGVPCCCGIWLVLEGPDWGCCCCGGRPADLSGGMVMTGEMMSCDRFDGAMDAALVWPEADAESPRSRSMCSLMDGLWSRDWRLESRLSCSSPSRLLGRYVGSGSLNSKSRSL